MEFSYKDLTYIRAAIQSYDGVLSEESEQDSTTNDACSEIQDDRLYLNRLLGLVNHEIDIHESHGPTLKIVKDND